VRRHQIPPRDDWRSRIEAQGLVFHETRDTGEYWAEGTYYELSAAEATAIEAATAALHALCVEAVRHVICARRFAEFDLDPLAIPLVERSFHDGAPSLYGRMDLALGPDGVPKLLEYNADTPTSLLEGGAVQWMWLADCFPDADQLNTIHDRLIAGWRALAPSLGEVVHFAHVDDLEDAMTVGYLRDTAEQAGLASVGLAMRDLGWDGDRLVDLERRPIQSLFKLYPWEGLVLDPLAAVLPRAPVTWLEPAWKMLVSNKAILPILWELFSGHPNLLPAAREPIGDAWVKKPLLGREGNNVTIVGPGIDAATPGPYHDRGFIYQAYAELGEHDGMRPVVGSWWIGGAAAGIGIRETDGYITSNTARFVPHLLR
jgi:glutathionylspermidine synthase